MNKIYAGKPGNNFNAVSGLNSKTKKYNLGYLYY